MSIKGKITTTVKLGKRQVDQEFYVVKDPIAGYQCLLGQDFLTRHSCGLQFSPTTVSFTVGGSPTGAGKTLYTRKFSTDLGHLSALIPSVPAPSDSAHSAHSDSARSVTNGTGIEPPVRGKERKSLLRTIRKGTCIAFRVVITPNRPSLQQIRSVRYHMSFRMS